jgi:LysM repeat protein
MPAPSAVSVPPAPVAHPPAQEDVIASAVAPSGPVTPAVAAPSGPVHMPANPPQLAPTTAVDSGESEQHAPAATHPEHALASTHEAKKEYYTVKITDSYSKIARAHHITVAELKAANHIKGDKLHTGSRLIIPESKTEVARSERSHDSYADATASTASLSASPVSHQHHYYTVTKGDTLAYIAHKFDVTVPELKDANDVTSTKQLRVGERIRIPSRESRTADTVSFRPTPAPAPSPAPVQPSQVETQPAPVVQPEPTPVATPEPIPQPSPTPASSPELANLTF